jgi:hypothetical protein
MHLVENDVFTKSPMTLSNLHQTYIGSSIANVEKTMQTINGSLKKEKFTREGMNEWTGGTTKRKLCDEEDLVEGDNLLSMAKGGKGNSKVWLKASQRSWRDILWARKQLIKMDQGWRRLLNSPAGCNDYYKLERSRHANTDQIQYLQVFKIQTL